MTVTSCAGIDNGTTGAVAILREDGSIRVERMPVFKVGKSMFIDESALSALLSEEGNPLTVFEQGQKNPLFGTKGNFANGYSFGVVQTVLKLGKVPHLCVNPQKWQKAVFSGMRGVKDKDTKGASIEFCRRRYPQVNLIPPRCRTPFDGFADAICMAHYASTLR
jgi:hypothetical protein